MKYERGIASYFSLQNIVGPALVADAHNHPALDHIHEVAAQGFGVYIVAQLLIIAARNPAVLFQKVEHLLQALLLRGLG